MKKCPACNNWTLDYDEYFGRYRCFKPDCAWMAPSATERQIRILRTYQQPKLLNNTTIPTLGINITASYDEVNDALIFDFNKREPSFEYPEDDGRMLWNIGRVIGNVTGFTIIGAKKFGISEIHLDIAARKENIERNVRNFPSALKNGKTTKILIESISVTTHSSIPESSTDNLHITSALQDAFDIFRRGFEHVR